MVPISKSIQLAGRELFLETGRFAYQANASVLGRYGETMVLTTVVESFPKEELDYFPLTVDYIERLYAGGRIKGSRWVKREGRPSDEGILISRLIDRSVRPLFPKEYKNEVQITTTLLSVDLENDPDVLSVITASAALALAGLPWEGPIGTVRVALKEKTPFVNPVNGEREFSDLDLVVSATKKKVVMIEAGAKQVPESLILEAVELGKKESEKIIDLILDLQEEVGVKPRQIVKIPENKDLKNEIIKIIGLKKIDYLIKKASQKESGSSEMEQLKDEVVSLLGEEKRKEIIQLMDEIFKQRTRQMIIEGIRPDGRKPDDLREIEAQVGILPRTHGSAMFRRGQTQVLSVTTLGAPSLEQLIESAEGEEVKRYIHHYSMPPYSVGETGKLGTPSRREIGHGALAERALEPVIPSEENFPYTIRVVSEVLSSNGSTSMASVCGSTLSLMDAGVPILAPVAGVAMGLVDEDDKHIVLTDIAGIEDFNGDMDFKIAGTKDGITAIQLDVKNDGLTPKLIQEILAKSKKAREIILDKMLSVIPSSREKISKYAPRVAVLHVDEEKIGDIIGSGGRTIRKIMDLSGAQIEIEDDGTVNISGVDDESVSKAIAFIEGLTKEIKVGEVYEGEVKRIQPFGVFVEILPGREGLVHISKMSGGYVSDPAKLVSVGQKVKVKVIEIDEQHRINLSMILDDRPFDFRPKGFIVRKKSFTPRKTRFPRR